MALPDRSEASIILPVNLPQHSLLLLCAISLFVGTVRAAEPAPPTEVTLTKRSSNGPYGTSAYSFRLASQDQTVHHNYVDLVFNGCGQLHINPVGGMKSRITDLGTGSLEAGGEPSATAKWYNRSIVPQAGHVYHQEIKDERQSFAVRFVVTEADADKLKLRWQPVDAAHQVLPLAAGKGAAGTMGQCGGPHPES